MASFRVRHAALLLILMVAALLRFQNLGAIEHNVDHAYPVWQALNTLDRGVFPVTAQGTSVLFDNPALTGYFFIPFVALTRSPLGAYVLTISLNTLAVLLAYRAARHFRAHIGEGGALMAAFLMAINPWVIEYSRTTWVQSLMPFFACLTFWLLAPVWLGTARRPARRTILGMIALTLMTETYLLAFAILAPVGLLMLLAWRRIPWKAVAAGGVIFAVVTGIYAAGLYANREETLGRVQEFSQGPARLSSEAWSHAVRLVTGRDYAIARGVTAPIADSVVRYAWSEVVHAALLAALILGLILAVWSALHRQFAGVVLLVWFGLPVLLMSYVSRPIHPFYLLLTLPAGYILAAWGMQRVYVLVQHVPVLQMPLARHALITLLLVIPTVLATLNVSRYAEATRAAPGAHDFSAMPLETGLDMMRVLSTQMPAPNAVVFADTDTWILNSFAGRLFPVDRDIDAARTTYIPRAGGFYMRFVPANAALPPAPVGTFTPIDYRLRDGSAIRAYAIPANALPDWRAEDITSDLGIAFAGSRAEQPLQPGAAVTVRTLWHITNLNAERGGWLMGPFVHVFDGSGKRILIGDGAVTPGAAWRLDDWQIKTLTFTLPADAVGPFTLRFGLYDGVHNRGAVFTLPDGSQSPTIDAR